MKRFGKILLLFVAVMMLVVCSATTSSAAVKKIAAGKGEKNAVTVSQGKAYCVTGKEYKGKLYFVKFTAPKTKKYKFQFSNFRIAGQSTKECIMNGSISFSAYDSYGYFSTVKLKMMGTDTYSLSICSEYSYSLSSGEPTVYTPLPKQTATLAMQKGQTVYVGFNLIDTCSVDMQIK